MNAAWTPAVRPSEAGRLPEHARLDDRRPPLLAARPPGESEPRPARPPADPPRSARPTEPTGLPPVPRRPDQDVDPLLETWRDQLAGLADPRPPAPADGSDDPLDLPPPPPPALVARAVTDPGSALRPVQDDDTMPLALVPLPRTEDPVDHPLDTPPRGLRTFDLGSVPASVTPPRTWRKAAWFAVGTSAAVVCGLAVAAVRLVDHSETTTIDALPAYPTGQLEIDDLPGQDRSAPETSTGGSRTSAPSSGAATTTGSTPRADGANAGSHADSDHDSSHDSPGGASAGQAPSAPGGTGPAPGGTGGAPTTTGATRPPPSRTTVGQVLIMSTDAQAMGDRTERYFTLVTEDPAAAHELCAGALADEGPEGIQARYAGVDRVEVQQITIDRAQGVTTSTVKIVREDGTEKVEQRRLTFTWGSQPRISDETTLDRSAH